jgi:hypothetical protein
MATSCERRIKETQRSDYLDNAQSGRGGHGGQDQRSLLLSVSGVVIAFSQNSLKLYILPCNDDDKHDMDSGYEYYPRAH